MADMTPPAGAAAFLDAHGWGGAATLPVAGDASFRRYFRIAEGTRLAILMDAPPDSGLRVEPFMAVTEWLRGLGLSAPEILAAAPEAGLLLLEDLGDALFIRVAADPAVGTAAYAAALDLLASLRGETPPARFGWSPPPYDRVVLMREMRLMPEWHLPAITGRPAPPG